MPVLKNQAFHPLRASSYFALAVPACIRYLLCPRQVDVSTRTEGAVDSAFADGHGLPLLVKYDIRHQQNITGPVNDIVSGVVEALPELSSAPPIPRSRAGLDLATTLERIQQNFVISDPSLPDCPIVFASESFLDLTEYSREEILGRNCRFLQGPGTDPRAVAEIREAISLGQECTVRKGPNGRHQECVGKLFWGRE